MVIRIFIKAASTQPTYSFVDKNLDNAWYGMEIKDGCLCIYKYVHPDHCSLIFSISGYFRAIQSEN